LLIGAYERFSPKVILDRGINGEEMGIRAMRNKTDVKELVFRCTICNLVLKQEKGEPPPSYCPNCAIQHLGGEMVPAPEHATDEER
jgi:hypothetical protein